MLRIIRQEKLPQTFTDANENEELKYPKASKQQLAREFKLLKALVEKGKDKGFVYMLERKAKTTSKCFQVVLGV